MAATFRRRKAPEPYRTRLTGRLATIPALNVPAVAMLFTRPAPVMVIARGMIVARRMMVVTTVVAARAIVVPAMIAIPVAAPIMIPTGMVSVDRTALVGVVNDGGPVFGLIDAAFADTAGRGRHGSDRSQHHNEFQSHFCLP